ncbi:MAG TPA: cation:proton antiporter [Ktedonobacterales bacterium]
MAGIDAAGACPGFLGPGLLKRSDMADPLHATIETLLILLLIIFVVAAAAERVRVPYPIALVLVGLFGIQSTFHGVRLTPNLILLVFLPVLLFEGAYNVSARRLLREIVPIAWLAIPGVLLATLVTGALLHLALGLAWAVALLFGALIASTDPIAVVSLFKYLRVPGRLALLVEGESLFNDGAAITLFQIILVTVVGGGFNLGLGVLRFVLTVAGALVVGAAVGVVGSNLMRRIDNAQAQIMASVVAAYGAYLLAETLTFSGAIAVVVAGLIFGNYGTTGGVSPRLVFALHTTWEFLGFCANSLIFLLIGIELDPLTLLGHWWPILIAFAAALLGRAVAVYGFLPWLRGPLAIPWQFRPALLWGGLRGAVSLALVLSLPLTVPGGQPFPDRGLLQVLAFGVVGLSLVAQGLTMAPLIRRLGLIRPPAAQDELAVLRRRLHATEDTLLVLAEERERGEISDLHYARLANAYQAEHDQLAAQVRQAESAIPAE